MTLRDPTFFLTTEDAQKHGVEDTFAQISMLDLGTSIDLERIVEWDLEDLAIPILAHEIGHHVLCPGNLVDLAKMMSLIKPVFGDAQRAASMENLFGDLLINDRLYKTRGLPMDLVYERMYQHTANSTVGDDLWTFYLRVYETLWSLPRGSLAPKDQITQKMDMDAGLAARILRVHGSRLFVAVKKLAYIFLPYFPLPQEIKMVPVLPNLDTEKVGEGDLDKIGGSLYGLTGISEEESEASGIGEGDIYGIDPSSEEGKGGADRGQKRTPAEFGQILADLGISLPPDKIAIMYYKELAGPELVPFPTTPRASGGSLPEGAIPWEVGEELESIDWELSIYESPVVVPGITTRQRAYGEDEGTDISDAPLYLDLYIDCSGSMPNPHYQLSYLTLAGVIMTLSALRAGAKVQATLWSDYGKFKSTHGFIDNEEKLLEIVTGFVSGGTGFPLNILRETYLEPEYPADEPPAHIMVISDDGIDTMLNDDELGNHGEDIARRSLEKARGGGTLLLNMYGGMFTAYFNDKHRLLKQIFDMFLVTNWSELQDFAREFSKRKYGTSED